MPALYPTFLKLDGLLVVVVGAGPVAASKLDGLVTANARIVVIAPAICDEIRARSNVSVADDPPRSIGALDIPRGAIVLVERAFAPPDLDAARWVVAAAPPDVNQQVAAAATARGLFVNAVDDTSAATAYLGGVIRRGEVEIAISTAGAAPALAGLLREALDALLPADLQRWVEVAKAARLEWKREQIPMAERRPLLLRKLVELYERRIDVVDLTGDAHRRPFLLRAIDRLGGLS